MEELLVRLKIAQDELGPEFKALRNIMGALNGAIRLASDEKADALPMQKALVKLEAAATEISNENLQATVHAFADETNTALSNLAYDFAKDLRDAFAARGENLDGRPPTLTVGLLTLHIDIAARKGVWLYGKEPLTRPIPLSIKGVLKAFDQQVKNIVNRSLNGKEADFLAEAYKAWQNAIDKRPTRRPQGGRINIVEIYSQITLNRQNNRFWNNPSRKTFQDYSREHFIRDLVLLRDTQTTTLTVDGQSRSLRLGIATKSQADQASRSVWLPQNALDGDYYGDITFDD
ncbi:MAG: hypothetical protein ACI9EW_001411 [Cellvibrionaceae bacterium]|jgi:hypothetical protein